MPCVTNYSDYLASWKTLKDRLPLYIGYSEVRCKFCNSKKIIKYGHFKSTRRWWCKDCHRKFADNDALPGMRTPINQIASAMHMYYDGMSFESIRKRLEQDYDSCPSDSTIYGWIHRFTKKALEETRNYNPKTGDVWMLHMTPSKIAGKKIWLLDIVDSGTQFLIASMPFSNDEAINIKSFLRIAAERVNDIPLNILIEEFKDFDFGIETVYEIKGKRVRVEKLNKRGQNKAVEYWNIAAKDRERVLRGLKDSKHAQLILDGWSVHYNFFRSHEALHGRTPAKKAGIDAQIGLSKILPAIRYE